MTGREFQFFITKPEFILIAERLLKQENLWCLVFYWPPHRAELLGKTSLQEALDPLNVNELLLSYVAPQETDLLWVRDHAGDLGLVVVDVPRCKDGDLLKCSVVARTHSENFETGEITPRLDTIRCYQAITTRLREILHKPLYYVPLERRAQVWYSDGARGWVEQGGRLKDGPSPGIYYRLPE